jgi:hypothetical protein
MNVAVMTHVVQVPSVKICQVHTSVNVLKDLYQILIHKLSVLEWSPALQTKTVQEMQSVMIINAVCVQNPMLEMNVDVSEKKLASYTLYIMIEQFMNILK